MGEREAHQLQCKPQSAQCSEKQQSPCEEEGGGGVGGLKFEKKKMLEKTIKPTPKKKLGIGSPVFCTFSFTLNPITYAQNGSSLGLFFNFSESGRGRVGGTAIAYLLCDY